MIHWKNDGQSQDIQKTIDSQKQNFQDRMQFLKPAEIFQKNIEYSQQQENCHIQ